MDPNVLVPDMMILLVSKKGCLKIASVGTETIHINQQNGHAMVNHHHDILVPNIMVHPNILISDNIITKNLARNALTGVPTSMVHRNGPTIYL